MSILVTRPEPAASDIVRRLRSLGKTAWAMPLIEFAPGEELPSLAEALSTLRAGDLLFALSQHAIHYAQPVLQHAKRRWPENIRYYAVGRRTALALHSVCREPVLSPPDRETSEGLLQLPELQDISGRRVLILRGNGGRELLAETLQQRGADVKFIECYQRQQKYYDGIQEYHRCRGRNISTLVVTSGEMLEQLYFLFSAEAHATWLLQCNLLVVSERLAEQARKFGWQHITIASNANNDALLHALL
ncbi:MAG: Uroporphyrinogen-III synthase [Candidatus Erwinia impunctatus]